MNRISSVNVIFQGRKVGKIPNLDYNILMKLTLKITKDFEQVVNEIKDIIKENNNGVD